MNVITPAHIPILLPPGYRLLPPGTVMETFITGERRPRLDLRIRDILDKDAEPREGSNGFSLYGGATITQVWDAANTRYTVCDARDPSGWFGLHCFGDKGSGNYNIPLQHKVTGRGSANGNAYTRGANWVGWEGSSFFGDVIPGFIAFPPTTAGGGSPVPGGAAYTKCTPIRKNPGYDGVAVPDGVLDMHALFGVPNIPISHYYIRLAAVDPSANVRARLGEDAANAFGHTVNTPAPNIEVHATAPVNADPNGNIYYSAVNGRPIVWIYLLGWWSL